MDMFIASFDCVKDDDLMLCHKNGVAYQRDMSIRVPYDEAYFNKCLGYENTDIACKINAGRISIVNKHSGAGTEVLDVGIGSGEFVEKRPYTFGFDVNPKAVEWLVGWNRYSSEFQSFNSFTFWDVIEHLEDPNVYFKHVRNGGFVFSSLPIFNDLSYIRESKHYRPGEHLLYFTESGFVDWMALYGFRILEKDDFEISAGRESILSFAFIREKTCNVSSGLPIRYLQDEAASLLVADQA